LQGVYAPRLIPPGTHPPIVRGKGSNIRHVTNILPETDPAHSLLVVEVITPNGNTSSYPPHKHDTDDLPNEALLEETYYHRLRGGAGFAFQRVYSGDRELDESVAVADGDVVLVRSGYHPVAGDPRTDLYYLNVMAGPARAWRVSVAPGY
jgi:5-deoxy-glucuronate isomerase